MGEIVMWAVQRRLDGKFYHARRAQYQEKWRLNLYLLDRRGLGQVLSQFKNEIEKYDVVQCFVNKISWSPASRLVGKNS